MIHQSFHMLFISLEIYDCSSQFIYLLLPFFGTREKKAHFVGFFFARCARKLMSGTLKYWNLAFLPPLLIMGFKVL